MPFIFLSCSLEVRKPYLRAFQAGCGTKHLNKNAQGDGKLLSENTT